MYTNFLALVFLLNLIALWILMFLYKPWNKYLNYNYGNDDDLNAQNYNVTTIDTYSGAPANSYFIQGAFLYDGSISVQAGSPVTTLVFDTPGRTLNVSGLGSGKAFDFTVNNYGSNTVT